METVVLGIILRDGKTLVGTIKKEKRAEYLGIPAILIGGDVEGTEHLEEKLKREIARKVGLQVTVEEKVAERVHPITKKHVHYFACMVDPTAAVALYAGSYFESVAWEDVFTASMKMLSLYSRVFSFLLERIGQFTLGTQNENIFGIEWQSQDIQVLGEQVRNGEVVAFPTETVYGLGANAQDARAVEKIFSLKGRPADNPLIVHVSSPLDLDMVARDVGPVEEMLFRKFSPGPVTVLLQKRDDIPSIVVAGSPLVGVRIPHNPFALELIHAAKTPIAAPSANISGKPSATHHTHVINSFGEAVPVIKAGHTTLGVESTVVRVEQDTIFILRQGALSKEEIQKEMPAYEVVIAGEEDKRRSASPGTRYRHYAPNAELVVLPYSDEASRVKRQLNKIIKAEEKKGKRVGVMAMSEIIPETFKGVKYDLGNSADSALRTLYGYLLQSDADNIDVLIAHKYSPVGNGKTLNERLERASRKS